MEKPKKALQLVVQDPDPSHVGRNIVTLDRKSKDELGVTSGDIVEIEGAKKTAAVIWPARAEDEGKGIVRMDNLIRHNAGVGLGEKIIVRKAAYQEAKKVILAPTQEVRIVASGYDRILKKNFIGRPLTKGDNVWISVFGSGFVYTVVDTQPRGVVKVTDFTQFVLREEPVKEAMEGVPKVAYEDIGGLEEQIQKIREMIELPMRHPELFRRLGITPPKGVLLYGPPGCGKTLLAKAVANETQAHFIAINAPALMSKFVGEAEERIRQVFKEAEENAPSIVFFDEIDAIAPKRDEVVGEVERRVVAQLLAAMDGMEARGNVIVIAATNRVNAIDEALRRPGRFDREIEIGVPTKKGRKTILLIHTRGMPLAKDIDLDYFAGITHGFVGADVAALAKEAAMKALRRYLPKIDLEAETIPAEMLESLEVMKDDFINALKEIQPSALREVTIEVPNVKWEEIGGLQLVKNELMQAVEWPLKHPDAFKKMGIKPPKGVLLYGPPGCGKTLIAKAVATESEANFISVKGPELISKWVGESLPYEEQLLVLNEKNCMERIAIGEIVEKKLNVKVGCFNENGKFTFAEIKDYIEHQLDTKMYEIKTRTGRKIRVTADHSLFTVVGGEVISASTSELIAGESYIAVPRRIEIPENHIEEINLVNEFVDDKNVWVKDAGRYLKEVAEKIGKKELSIKLGVKEKYCDDIIRRRLSLPLPTFMGVVLDYSLPIDWNSIKLKTKGSRATLNGILKLNNPLMMLVGLWIAEGDYNNGMIRIHQQTAEVREVIEAILKELKLPYTKAPLAFIINSQVLTKVFTKVLGLPSGSKNKRLPDRLLTLGKEQLAKVLLGYYSGDGSIHGNRHRYYIDAYTQSQELANDLAFALLRFGILATTEEKKEWNGSITYRVRFSGVENFRIFKRIGFIDCKRDQRISDYISSKKWERSDQIPLSGRLSVFIHENLRQWAQSATIGRGKLLQLLRQVDLQKDLPYWNLAEADICWDRIEEIKEIAYAGFVYDLNVEPCQNFLAGFGGIFAHNSEKGIRKIFGRARQVSPVIVFFDEIDSIAARRGSDLSSGVGERVVNQLLTELDGIEELKDVVFIAATNRPDLIDPGLMRPGRIDKVIYIPPPDEKSRMEVFKVHMKNVPVEKNVDVHDLVAKTEGYSGADIEGLIREAVLISLSDNKMKPKPVEKVYFDEAIKKVLPSITKDTAEAYEAFRKIYTTFKPSYVG